MPWKIYSESSCDVFFSKIVNNVFLQLNSRLLFNIEKLLTFNFIVKSLTMYFYSGLGVRVFANGLGDLGSIPGRVIPKTQKMVLDASLLSTQHYKVRIKGKVEQSRKGVAPSPTHWCSSYRKGSLRVTLHNGRQQLLNIEKLLTFDFIVKSLTMHFYSKIVDYSLT